MKYVLAVVVAVYASCLFANQDLSLEDKKLMTGSLYLSTCVLGNFSNDFRNIGERFNQNKYLKPIAAKNDHYKFYVDKWAATRISLSKDSCMVEIANKDLDKFASSLPSILEVGGGKLELKKTDDGYEGTLVGGIRDYLIEASFHPDFPDRIAAVLLSK